MRVAVTEGREGLGKEPVGHAGCGDRRKGRGPESMLTERSPRWSESQGAEGSQEVLLGHGRRGAAVF